MRCSGSWLLPGCGTAKHSKENMPNIDRSRLVGLKFEPFEAQTASSLEREIHPMGQWPVITVACSFPKEPRPRQSRKTYGTSIPGNQLNTPPGPAPVPTGSPNRVTVNCLPSCWSFLNSNRPFAPNILASDPSCLAGMWVFSISLEPVPIGTKPAQMPESFDNASVSPSATMAALLTQATRELPRYAS